MNRTFFKWIVALIISTTPNVYSFSGEDPVNGNPWYHELMTKTGSSEAGFTTDASATIAWHADYVDSYLYNPLFWAQGGLDRYKVSLATAKDLSKLHFDDLFSTDRVMQMWNRHMSGTIIGLLWALEHNDVAAAQHVIGVSCHVLQDLYSHSNWMDDPSRRTRTWFEVSEVEKRSVHLWTGYYEQPAETGILPHGKIAPACVILDQSDAMDALCSAFSPLNTTSLCLEYDRCKQGLTDRPESVLGIPVPENTIYFAPPGIALDSKWTSRIAIMVRNINEPGLTGDSLFNMAVTLATRTTTQWLSVLQQVITAEAGGSAFWTKLKTESTWDLRTAQFEAYNKRYFQFLTSGPYPPESNSEDNGYYLRLRLSTGDVTGGGTDADIIVKAEAKEFLLDNNPRANPILNYNDFETGDDDVYVVGPFDSLPSQIVIENKDADAGDVASSLWNSFTSSVTDVINNMESYLLSIIGGNADLVAQNKIVWTGTSLNSITTAGSAFTVRLNGGDEGDYEVYGTIKKVSSDQENTTYSISLSTLHCISESDWDRGSDSDEPFVLALLAPLPGADLKYRTEPYNDVDDGENNTINYTFPDVTVPTGFGAIFLSLLQMESDDESGSARDQALNQLGAQTENATADEERDFIDNLGAAVAADWYLQNIEVFAFRRGPITPASGLVLNSAVGAWIDGGSSRTFSLNKSGFKEWPINIPQLASMTTPVHYAKKMLRPRTAIRTIDGACIIDSKTGMKVQIIDQLGRQIYASVFPAAQKVQIPLGNGCYLVKITYNDGIVEKSKLLMTNR